MAVCIAVIRVSQHMMHTMNKPIRQPIRQPELPLSHEAVLEALSEEVIAQCRQLVGQMLREVLQAEKEAQDEH
jgi:hypothetical protein